MLTLVLLVFPVLLIIPYMIQSVARQISTTPHQPAKTAYQFAKHAQTGHLALYVYQVNLIFIMASVIRIAQATLTQIHQPRAMLVIQPV